jgi:murein DD-endopeptidase MepM/ murein hydrolase activator NlpD
VTAGLRRRLPSALLALFLATLTAPAVHAEAVGHRLRVTWQPARPRTGDVVLMRVRGAPAGVSLEAVVDGRPVGLFRTRDGHAALIGIDMDAPAGPRRWQVTARGAGAVAAAEGELAVRSRAYTVQHLTVAPGMVDLDPATERRAVDETERLRLTYRRISGERLWRGRWLRPVSGDEPGSGFGSRRVINGQPRAPHSGTDFAAPLGATVLAANGGRVALVAEFFFPGRLVILDHGLGLHTAYFHLDTIAVTEGQVVARGEPLGTVGMTGRVTGPHLHFGAQLGPARIDPAVLLGLAPGDDGRD